MHTYRSRNRLSDKLDTKKIFSSTDRIEEKKYPKKKFLTNLTEYAGEARTIIQNNNSLKQQISILKKNNLLIKNYISKIIIINKDMKLKNNNNTHNHFNKDNIYNFIKEYNELIKENNNIIREKVEKEKEKNENYQMNLEFKTDILNKSLEESLNINFLLDNKNKYKDNIIKALKQNYENITCIQEITRYRFINEEFSQHDVDKFFKKYLSIFQESLLNITHNWNKYRNKIIKFENEKEELLKNLENPEKIEEKQKISNENKTEKNLETTENELFLLTFDEFEDESQEVTLDSENIQTNQDEENNTNTSSNINNKNNYIKINNNYNKMNTNNKYNKINNLKSQNAINKRLRKKDLYYIPQKDYSRSLIKNSESMRKILQKGNINICPIIPKNDRNISINTISKLNLKQIVFNKNNKFLKEEAKEMAIKKYKIENEYKINISNNIENLNEIKIQMEMKETKKDIKLFKEKIKRKKKIIKEFKIFYNDISKKYNLYVNNNNIKDVVTNL